MDWFIAQTIKEPNGSFEWRNFLTTSRVRIAVVTVVPIRIELLIRLVPVGVRDLAIRSTGACISSSVHFTGNLIWRFPALALVLWRGI